MSGTNSPPLRRGSGWQQRGPTVIDRGYLTRQAAWLMKFAKSTGNPELAAALVDKAADLKAREEALPTPPDPSPRPPDVERPA